MKKIFTILLALSALSLIIGGCGGGSGEGDATKAPDAGADAGKTGGDAEAK